MRNFSKFIWIQEITGANHKKFIQKRLSLSRNWQNCKNLRLYLWYTHLVMCRNTVQRRCQAVLLQLSTIIDIVFLKGGYAFQSPQSIGKYLQDLLHMVRYHGLASTRSSNRPNSIITVKDNDNYCFLVWAEAHSQIPPPTKQIKFISLVTCS